MLKIELCQGIFNMRIGLLVTSMGSFGENSYYNSQEVGLAKGLSAFFDEVIIYKVVHNAEQKIGTNIDGYNVKLNKVPSKGIGINGFIDLDTIDKSLDAVIYFSDTQLILPRVYKWSRKNDVRLIPYIGTIKSHSNNAFIRFVSGILADRNIRVYKKCTCLCKTPMVQQKLRKLGIERTELAPVGLDADLLNNEYDNYDASLLKKRYGYKHDDKVLLFVGRLVEEKQPIRMVELFRSIVEIDKNYKLIIVGDGELKASVNNLIQKYGIANFITIIPKVLNSKMWELYRIADAFINLNTHEIFGMCILEAMYYKCKVIAWRAPGPEYIIDDGVSGWIVDSDKEVIDKIFDLTSLGEESHNRVLEAFTWKTTAKVAQNVIENF